MLPDTDLRHAFDALSHRLRDTIAREMEQTAADIAARLADLPPGIDEPGSTARLLRGVRAIDGARSLTGVLDALVDATGGDGIRVALVLVRGPHLRRWRDRGFDSDALPSELTLDDAGPIAVAVRTRSAVSGWTTAAAPIAAFAASDRVCVAVPLQLAGEAVAVLYADRRASDAALPGWRAIVELLARHASRVLESITAFRTARHLTAQRAGGEIATVETRQP